MERGALIGGAAVVVLLGVFAGLFVALNLDSDTDPDVAVATPTKGPDGQPLAIPAIPARPDGTPDPAGTAGNAVQVDAQDTDAAAQKRLGAEEWARLRAERELQIQARARATLETFMAGRSDVDADIMRDTFDHLFITSGAIREDMRSGAITLAQGRAEMTRLRTDTTRTVTDTIGPDGLRQLRDELKRADAPLF